MDAALGASGGLRLLVFLDWSVLAQPQAVGLGLPLEGFSISVEGKGRTITCSHLLGTDCGRPLLL